MGQKGPIAPELPENFGGLGTRHLLSGLIVEEIGKAVINFGYVPLLVSLNGQKKSNFARPEIARDCLPGLISGEHMLAIALTGSQGWSALLVCEAIPATAATSRSSNACVTSWVCRTATARRMS